MPLAGLAGCVPIDPSPSGRLAAKLRLIEVQAGGQLGVFALEPHSGASLAHRAHTPFPLLSTFKLSLAGLFLHRARLGVIDPDEKVRWTAADLDAYAPFTQPRTGEGATWRELARAAQVTSDNTAANLVLKRLGGPEALTAFWRSLGDETSRLDRLEPELNLVPPGEMRDTTTPAAMARTLVALLYEGPLDPRDRVTLAQWMVETRTGMRRTRGGFPEDWHVGDKTGTSLAPGMGSVYADIGFAEPPGRAAIVFATYYRASEQHLRIEPAAQETLRQAGEVIAAWAQRPLPPV